MLLSGITIGYWGGLCACASTIYALGVFLSSHICQEKKDNVALWLWGEYQTTWSSQFCDVFDSVFGEKHLSWKCFFRSCLVSIISVLFVYFLLNTGFDIFGEGKRVLGAVTLQELFIYGALLNFIPDYISLFETRWLLKRFSYSDSFIAQVVMLLLDLIFTLVIISIYITLTLLVFGVDVSVMKMVAVFSEYSIFFYSTFSTSLMALLFCVSTWVMRLTSKTNLGHWLEIEDKPLRQIGAISAFFILIIGVILSPAINRQDSKLPNYIENMACELSADTCLDVIRITSNEQKKIELFSLACLGGITEQCIETGIKVLNTNKVLASELFDESCRQRNDVGCLNLGVILHSQKKMDEAIEAYRTSISINPLNISAYSYLGVALEIQQKRDEAEKAFRTAYSINPGHESAYYNFGAFLRNQNKANEAEKVYRTAIRINPNDAGPHGGLGDLFSDQNKHNKAEQAYRTSLKLNPNQAHIYNSLGQLLGSQNRNDEAVKSYQASLKINPNQGIIHNNLGRLLINKNRNDEALEAFRKAVSLIPDRALLLHNLGALRKKNKIKEAIRAYSAAVNIDPQFTPAYIALGVSFQQQNKHAEAEVFFRSAIKIDPNLAKAYYNLGVSLQQQRRYEEVEKLYRRAISIKHNFFSAHINLGTELMRQKKTERS